MFSIEFFSWNLRKLSMESTETFHGSHITFRSINGKNLRHFLNFHRFLYCFICHQLPWKPLKSRANTPTPKSIFIHGFQWFSMAYLETERDLAEFNLSEHIPELMWFLCLPLGAWDGPHYFIVALPEPSI